jgi:hypothetical protein
MATEFTRDIKPIDLQSTPVIPEPTGSVVADVANLANTGFQVFAREQNKQREARTSQLTQRLGDLEVELTQNGLSRTEVLERLDSEIKRMAPDPSTQGYLRQQFGSQRGAFVRNQLVQQINNEELQRQAQIEAEFQQAVSNNPLLAASVKRGERGEIDEADKLAAIEEFNQERARLYLADQRRIQSEKDAQGAKQDALSAVSGLSESLQVRLSEPLRLASSSYLSLVNTDLEDPENLQMLKQAGSNLVNVLGIYESQIESEFDSIFIGNTDPDVREMIKANKEAMLGGLQTMRETLTSGDADVAKRIAANVQILEQGLKLKGFQAFEPVAIMEQIAPNAGRYIFEALVNTYPALFEEAKAQTAFGLSNVLSQDNYSLGFTNSLMDYYENSDPTGKSDIELSAFYEAARGAIDGPAIKYELSATELNKISGGLIGILSQAAITDDPAQVKEATKLLNSDNFDVFFKQLPVERQEALGRFINQYNTDMLTDASDGLLKGLERLTNQGNISYDAEKGEFIFGGIKTQERKAGSGLVGNELKEPLIQQKIEEANQALRMIRENAQYDDTGLSDRELIDTMLSVYMPQGVEVKGELQPFQQEDTGEESVQDSEGNQIPINRESILKLQQRIMELEAAGLSLNQGSSTDNQEAVGVDYAAQAESQGVDLSSFEDGEYEDGNGNTVVIQNGQIVSVN